MDALPSYEEATTAPDWLQIVAPYVPTTAWRPCCLVNSAFYRHFAPRLWLDPLISARTLGLHPNDDLAWYRYFVKRHTKSVRRSTRQLVRSLDFRDFAIAASGLYSTEASERAISESFKTLPLVFPSLVCLIIDSHPELDPSSLIQTSSRGEGGGPHNALQLLDLAYCRHELSSKLFGSSYFRDLVYLDVSFVPGSVRSAVQSSLNPECLPQLRVLKVRGREMDDSTARLLFSTFRRQLWSLDVSSNKLTDASIDALIETSFTSLSFRSDAHFETEGRLVNPRQLGSIEYGPFDLIKESYHSASFDHPERYIPDAPSYSRRGDQGGLQEWQVVRSDGVKHRKEDSVNAIRQLILKDVMENTASTSVVLHHNVLLGQGGITHLYLSGNSFTSAGLEKLVKVSYGRLEHLECDSCRFWSPGIAVPNSLPKSLEIHGVLGSSHFFRPVFSSNLRSLRLHHSAITRIPTIKAAGITSSASCVLAETTFLERIKLAYPQPLMPDLNPRLTSVTLAGIPARSVGPLIVEITRFLDLASAQQQAVADVAEEFNQRGSFVLHGLRHIRLELEPDHTEDSPSLSADDDSNFDKLLDPANDESGGGSSIFDDDSWDITSRASGSRIGNARLTRASSNALPSTEDAVGHPYLFNHRPDEYYINHRVDAADSWNGNVFSLPVWVGNGTPGSYPAVNEYMANLRDIRMHRGVGPAMPNHVAAGVPWGAYIFHAAWDSMVFPKQLPLASSLSWRGQLRDVATAIKEHRLQTKGTNRHWNGKLELVRMNSATRYHSSDYWR